MVLKRFVTRLEPLSSLESVLPQFFSSLSLARAHIALEQVRSAIQSGDRDRFTFVTAGTETGFGRPLAAALAVQATSSDVAMPGGGMPGSDLASMVHAAYLDATPLCPLDDCQRHGLQSALFQSLEDHLRRRGVGFMQWSTDPVLESMPHSIANWCRAFGFDNVATLDYLSSKVSQMFRSDVDGRSSLVAEATLRLETLDWSSNHQWDSFCELVEATYSGTLDCPQLAEYRSTRQTLTGYRESGVFTPTWWFRLTDATRNEPIGCLILGRHIIAASEESTTGDVMEIVYMGLVPTARGRGFGLAIMRRVHDLARHTGCSQLILAVDQQNRPAASVYHRAGLSKTFSETVWVKTISPG